MIPAPRAVDLLLALVNIANANPSNATPKRTVRTAPNPRPENNDECAFRKTRPARARLAAAIGDVVAAARMGLAATVAFVAVVVAAATAEVLPPLKYEKAGIEMGIIPATPPAATVTVMVPFIKWSESIDE
jgi:hypothetical protein